MVVVMMDWGYMGPGSGAMVFGWLVGLMLLIGIGVLVVTRLAPREPSGTSSREPTDTLSLAESELELRYARGEIDAATLLQARSVLRRR